jgi:hypothetical protein
MEEKVVLVGIPDGVWVLDTGASNHMTGSLSALSQLDRGVRGTVKFFLPQTNESATVPKI